MLNKNSFLDLTSLNSKSYLIEPTINNFNKSILKSFNIYHQYSRSLEQILLLKKYSKIRNNWRKIKNMSKERSDKNELEK